MSKLQGFFTSYTWFIMNIVWALCWFVWDIISRRYGWAIFWLVIIVIYLLLIVFKIRRDTQPMIPDNPTPYVYHPTIPLSVQIANNQIANLNSSVIAANATPPVKKPRKKKATQPKVLSEKKMIENIVDSITEET